MVARIAPRVNRIVGAAGNAQIANATDGAARISIPSNIGEQRTRKRDAAERIQSEVRSQFESLFAKGYVATAIESTGASTDYILQSQNAVAVDIFPQAEPRKQ